MIATKQDSVTISSLSMLFPECQTLCLVSFTELFTWQGAGKCNWLRGRGKKSLWNWLVALAEFWGKNTSTWLTSTYEHEVSQIQSWKKMYMIILSHYCFIFSTTLSPSEIILCLRPYYPAGTRLTEIILFNCLGIYCLFPSSQD